MTSAVPNYGPIGELDVAEWIGDPPADTLAQLRGRVVVIEAFQMLCPGCVAHGLPQAARVHRLFRNEDLLVLGLPRARGRPSPRVPRPGPRDDVARDCVTAT